MILKDCDDFFLYNENGDLNGGRISSWDCNISSVLVWRNMELK